MTGLWANRESLGGAMSYAHRLSLTWRVMAEMGIIKPNGRPVDPYVVLGAGAAW